MTARHNTPRFLIRVAFMTAGSLLGLGCGDDEPSDSERIAAACESACGGATQGCGLETPEASCRTACEIGGNLTAGCAREYERYLSCASDGAPIVTCDGDTVTIAASVSACVEPLTGYLSCAATATVPACFDAPAQNAECEAEGLGSRAVVCGGEPEGCTLFEGSLRSEGAGLFCCP